MVKKTEKPN